MPNQIQDLFGKWIQFDCPTDGAAFSIAVANRVWDPGTLSWVSETQPAGGGGGPATIADGADVTQGAIADAAVVSDAPGTISAKLRGLVKIQASVWDSANGRLKVDGSGVIQPVSGTVSISSFPASQAVTIADGADVAEGSTTDAAVVTDVNGTVSAKLRGLVKIAANGYGTWNYAANTLNNTGSVTGSGKCIGIRVFAAGTDSEFNINGGDTIKVRSGAGVDVNPGGNLTAPTVNWVSGTIDIVIEGLT